MPDAKLAQIKKEAQDRADRAKAEAKAAEQLVKAIEGYEKLEEMGIVDAAAKGEQS